MKNSAVTHIKNDSIVVVRKSFLDICEVRNPDGSINSRASKSAGILLSYFEYWHNVKINMASKAKALNDVSERHGDARKRDESLLQFHTTEEIMSECLGLLSLKGIKAGREVLVNLGFLSEHKNPNPKYKFDNTVFYLLHADVVESTLSSYLNDRTVLPKRPDGPTQTTGTRTVPSPESSKKSLTISPPLGRGGERYKDSTEKKKETAGVEKEMNSSVGDVEEREARPPALKERKKRIKREDKLITLDDGTVVSIKEESKRLCGVLEGVLDAKRISPLVRGSSASVGGFSWLLDKGVTPTAIKEAISALYAPENSDQLPPLVRSGESMKKKWESGVIPFLERVKRKGNSAGEWKSSIK